MKPAAQPCSTHSPVEAGLPGERHSAATGVALVGQVAGVPVGVGDQLLPGTQLRAAHLAHEALLQRRLIGLVLRQADASPRCHRAAAGR